MEGYPLPPGPDLVGQYLVRQDLDRNRGNPLPLPTEDLVRQDLDRTRGTPPMWTNKKTKNITFPCISYAGGKKYWNAKIILVENTNVLVV